MMKNKLEKEELERLLKIANNEIKESNRARDTILKKLKRRKEEYYMETNL